MKRKRRTREDLGKDTKTNGDSRTDDETEDAMSDAFAAEAAPRGEDCETTEDLPDPISTIFACHDFDALLAFTEHGRVYTFQALDVPARKRGAEGVAITDLMPTLRKGHRITAVVTVPQGNLKNLDDLVILVTTRGKFKRVGLSGLPILRPGKECCVMPLEDGDEIGWVHRASEADLLVLASSAGYVLTFPLANKGSRNSSFRNPGKIVMKLREGDRLASTDIVKHPFPGE